MPEAVSGIWMALRHTSNDVIICKGCTKLVAKDDSYCERTIGEPIIMCSYCIGQMIEARFQLLEQGD